VKLPAPPSASPRPPPNAPDVPRQRETAEHAHQDPPSNASATDRLANDVEVTELPRTGFNAAAHRSKALLHKAHTAVFAPALAHSRALLGKARAGGPAWVIEQNRALLDKVRLNLLAWKKEGRRPPWLIPLVTAAGLCVGVGLAVVLSSHGDHRKDGESMQSSQTPSVASATLAPSSSVPVSSVACALAGAPRVVAPIAVVAVGVEARPFGDSVALGFAPADNEAAAVRLDLDSLTATESASARSADPIRRVRPALGPKGTLGLMIDADRQRDDVRGRRTLPMDPPLQTGAVGNDLVWTRSGGPPAGKLWSLDGPEDLDALRAASEGLPERTTTAIAFRRGSAIWVGMATGHEALAPSGALSRIDGLGTTIGSPAVAIDQGIVMIAWADRPSADVPWRLRIAHMRAGDRPSDPVNFTPPPGGPGVHAMSPGLGPVPGGGFLLTWTEGPMSQQRVRGITLTLSGQPIGEPLEISSEGVNSGQGQVAMAASPGARGVVAFLQATQGGFGVAATRIVCGS